MNLSNLKCAIVLPAGSGKTTLSLKYKNIYDIDSFHSLEDRKALKKLYEEVDISKDWDRYNIFEINLIQDKIEKLHKPYILLLHAKEKAELLNIRYLGSCKTTETMMEKVASSRGKKDKLWGKMTRENWKYTNAPILNSFEEIREYIINLAGKNNIYLEPNNI